jgi:L-malate glycosyltransferase
MPKVLLISQFPLPFSSIGSWTTMYKNYLQSSHQIDCVICPEPTAKFEGVQYSFVSNTFFDKINRKLQKNPYLGYLKALKKIVQPNERYLIQIVDNYGIVKPLQEFLIENKIRENCYLQFFYHSFAPFHENFYGRWFFESVDEMVLLTYDSYLAHKNYYTILPTRFSVLHNGIDTQKFFPLSETEKKKIREEKGVSNKKVFVWCSQDRLKKGLHIILDVWKKIYATRQDVVLWIIGCEPKTPQEGVVYLSKIANDLLPSYFQASDCYLFPTLWHEGFGLSLIEALHCGNYCIASSTGGVPEVLQYGKLGKLIENPHFIAEWEQAILDFLENKQLYPLVDKNLYSSEAWNIGMNEIIHNAKNSF